MAKNIAKNIAKNKFINTIENKDGYGDIEFANKIFIFDSESECINHKTLKNVLQKIELIKLNNRDGRYDKIKEIEIYINTYGGLLDQGVGIHDIIKNCKKLNIKTNGIVYGECCSSGVIILQACDRRIISENSHIMIHYGSISISDSNPQDLYSRFNNYKNEIKTIESILVNRINQTISERIKKDKNYLNKVIECVNNIIKTQKFNLNLIIKEKNENDFYLNLNNIIYEFLSRDTYLNAQESYILGLIDEII